MKYQYTIQYISGSQIYTADTLSRSPTDYSTREDHVIEEMAEILVDQVVEHLIPTQLPFLPWEMVGMDLFEFKRRHYLLVIDYFSRYIEVACLESTTSRDVITEIKKIFPIIGYQT